MSKDLFIAARAQKWSVISEAIKQSTLSQDKQDEKGYGLLHYAAIDGNVAVINQLIDDGNNINLATANGSSPLHKAATFGQIEAINVLLSRGANLEATTSHPDIPSFSGRTALHEAAVEGHSNAAKLLLEHGANKKALTEANETAKDLAVFYQHRDTAAVFDC